jgi:hypothetical protein
MPSTALQAWATGRAASLDEVENAHRAVGGTGPGRRYLTQQVNFAYAVLLSSQFQAFCREFHSECSHHVVAAAPSPVLQAIYRSNLRHGRKLDTGNPNAANLGADFNRFGFSFWAAVDVEHPRSSRRRRLLEGLNRWRNAIAHHDFAPDMLRGGRPTLHLSAVQSWRKACDGLAQSFENVMRAHLLSVTGVSPW